MKNLLIISLAFVFLQSCVTIYFIEPQPENGILMQEIPKELQGVWKIGDGIIRIESQRFLTTNLKGDSIETELTLSDTTKLFKIRKMYILNTRQTNSDWEIVILERNRKGDISTYQTVETRYFTEDRKLQLEEAHFIIDEEDTIVHTLDPSYENSISFQSATFSGQMRFGTIKKIVCEENLMFVLKADGTCYSADRTLED